MLLKTPTVPKANESSAPYAPGDTIAAKYRLERLLGEGGMGAVWAAHNVALDSPVAIKLIRGEADREALSVRLQLEARAAARLGHPAIVRIFDIGQTDKDDPFIVMELLDGESLATRLDRQRRLSSVDVVQILLPIADALRAAHAKGIVHRDIKPDNIFIAVEGDVVQPKLVDFGIAKLEQASGASQITQHGVVVGSPDYMSPEQARGDTAIDYRTDVWAFCVVLYEAVTGGLPFDAENYNALLRAILEEKPPTLLELAAGDSELSSIVAVGMAKDRNERWRSMQELGIALAGWLKRQGVLEDAAGASLDTKWLNRRSDPAGRLSRPSLGSIPDGAFSPASGVAVTVRAPKATDSATPASLPKAPPYVVFGMPRRIAAFAGAFIAALVLLVVYLLLRTPAAREDPEMAAQPPAAPEPLKAPLAAPLAVPTPGPEPAPPEDASATVTLPKERVTKPNARRPASTPKKPASESPERPPSSDLIAPY
jgi:serine/threonine-protein kinase